VASLNPSSIVHGCTASTTAAGRLRQALIIGQFTLSTALIIFTFMASRQLTYVGTTDLGLDTNHIVNIPIKGMSAPRRETIKDAFTQLPGVTGACFSDFLMSGNNWNQNVSWERLPADSSRKMRWIPVDHDFVQVFGIDILEGQGFTPESPALSEYILNEAAVEYIGWQEPIGKQFRLMRPGSVVGVARNFNFHSLHNKIEPCILVVFPRQYSLLSMRLKPEGISATLAQIEKRWREFVPGRPFQYSFAGLDRESLYRSERRTAGLFQVASMIAILVSCLGLLSLISQMTLRRRREIGIRKALGSSVTSIVILLTGNLVRLVVLTNLAAWPIAYFYGSSWLNNFAYQIDIGWDLFFLPGLLTLAIVLATVSFQSLRAARANPVEALKCE
jgi:putative ABC transport system permease protein